MRTIRWGIIGCGDVTEVKSGPGFQKAAGSELVAVMRRNGELAKDYAQRHHVPKWYDNADSLIQDAEVDAVYIATPPAFHMEYAVRCARAGKIVYVEKPMALDYEDGLAMAQICREANVPLFVAFYRRAMDYFIKVRELVQGGSIGEIRFISIIHYSRPSPDEMQGQEKLPWRLIPQISGGGKFYDLAPHTLDILDFICGPVKKACGTSGNQAGFYNAEDIVTANLEFSSGALGTGVWCFSSFKAYERNEIVGSKGKISFSTFSQEPIVVENLKGTVKYEIERPQHVQQPLIQSIVNELNGGGVCPSNGESALRTSRVMDEIIKRP